MKVLVIEDNKADQRLLQEMFRDMNMPVFKLVFAENLTKGIAYLDTEDIGIVLLDLGLPESQGLNTFLRLKGHAENIPVIVLTGLDDTSIALNALKEGAQDYLIKGLISPEILKKSVLYATERQRLNEELRQSNREIRLKEARFRRLIEKNADAMVVLNKKEEVQYQNPAAKLLFDGATADYLKISYVSQFDGARSIERTLDFPAGIQKIIEIRGVLIEWDRLPAFLLTIRDITERKQVEEELRESRDILSYAFYKSPLMKTLSDLSTGKYLEVNDSFCRVSKFSREEVIGKTAIELGWTSKDERMRMMQEVQQAGWVNGIELPLRSKNGQNIIARYWGTIIHTTQGDKLFSTAEDITERKLAEETLQATRVWLGIALRAARAGTWDWDIPTGKLVWSPEFFDLFGLSPGADPSFETWRAALHPDDLEQATASIDQSIREHSYLWNEYRIILPDGQVRWIGAGGSTTYAAGGEPVRMSGVCIDITDRKLAEVALQLTQSRLESAMEAGNIAWWEMDCTTGNVSFSERKARMLGYPAEQFSHYTDFTTLLHPDDSEPAM